MYKLLLLILLMTPIVAQAQIRQSIEFKLLDGTPVSLLLQPAQDAGSAPLYNYLPTNLRLSEVGGHSEFSFLPFRPDSLSPLSGGILHLLMTWGLSKAQFEEAEDLLAMRTDSVGVLAGSVFLQEDPEHPSLEIVSDSPIAQILRRSINSASHTPLNAGSKLAVSFNFNAEDAEKIEKALERPEAFKGIVFQLHFILESQMYSRVSPKHLVLKADFEQWIKKLK